jgi:carbon monoxide dehydrogenase subunit G
VELTHDFTVPVDRETAWAAFQDIAVVAECFPGATVTSVEGDSFDGTVKVKLGPIALQYAGGGRFVERDAAAYRLVIEAKGRDRRGNGTAGADVTASFTEEGQGTRIEVLTSLQITGKPAQFGRGVIQDVSDKLLQQFLGCLESRIAPAPAEEPEVEPVPEPLAAMADVPVEPPPAASALPPRTEPKPADDAIDLGTTVLPVLAKAYWKPAALLALVVLLLVGWRARRR